MSTTNALIALAVVVLLVVGGVAVDRDEKESYEAWERSLDDDDARENEHDADA